VTVSLLNQIEQSHSTFKSARRYISVLNIQVLMLLSKLPCRVTREEEDNK
jgi:hypothetical protein